MREWRRIITGYADEFVIMPEDKERKLGNGGRVFGADELWRMVFSRGEGWSKNEISALLMALVMREAPQEHRFDQAYYLEIYHVCNVVVNDLRNRGELSDINGPEQEGNRWHYSRTFAMATLGHIRDRLEGKAWCNWRSVSVDDTLNELGITMDVVLRAMGEVDLD